MTRPVVLTLVLTLALSACSAAVPPLRGGRESAAALARDVLAALAADDPAALAGLALSEQEFRDHVWPDLPAARPERNLPFPYVWGDLKQKSDAGLRASLTRLRGRPTTLVDVRFSGTTAYGASRVHRDSVFVVRHADGTVEDLEVCGSFIERGAQWKVFSFVRD